MVQAINSAFATSGKVVRGIAGWKPCAAPDQAGRRTFSVSSTLRRPSSTFTSPRAMRVLLA